MQTQNVQRSFVDRMREEFKHDLSLLSQSAQHINKYSCSLHITRTMSQLTIQYNKSVFSFLRRLTTWHCPHLPAAAAERWPAVQQSIDISCPLQPTAASLQQRVCCCGPMLGQTDRETNGHRTVTCTVDPAPHTMMAVLTRTTRWPKIIQQQATSQRKASLYGKI